MTHILIDIPVHEAAMQQIQSMADVTLAVVEAAEEIRPLPPDLLRDVQILFCTFPPENFDDMQHIELMQIASAGYTQLFGLDLSERGVRACNATGVNDIPIAEWNVAMMVNLARDLPTMFRNQQQGVWDRSARFQKEVRDSVVGIWGYGGIGRETARLAKQMGMTVYAMDAASIGRRDGHYIVPGTGDPDGVLPDKTFMPGQECAFLSDLDFLVLSMPLTKKTEGRIGIEELKMLPTKAYLLNPARGHLVHEEALLRALREGWIAGAAIDTHYYYPMPADHPLWAMPNVIMTPHISGSSRSPKFLARIWDVFVQNVQRYLADGELLNELSPEQLRGM